MKKLMILGAGIYQVPLIKKAKEMGFMTIVISIKGNYPGFNYADTVYYIDTTDSAKVLEVAQKENIDGIVTTGTDVAIATLGLVCEKMRLPGIKFSAATKVCDKKLMKEAFYQGMVNTAQYKEAATNISEYELINTCVQMQFPLVFKAVDSSGSRGIEIVKKREDILSAFNTVLSVTKQNYFIIEEFLNGQEFGAQAFVQNGKIEFVLPHGDYIFQSKTGVPIGHFVPYTIDMESNLITNEVVKAVKILGLDNCALNLDFIYAKNKIYVLEIGARCGATCLAELVSIWYGFDYYEKIIEVAMGIPVDFSPKNTSRVPNASKLLISSSTGKILNINNSIKNITDYYELQFDYTMGDFVKKFSVGSDRIGHIITVGETLNEAELKLNNCIKNISFEIEE